MASVEDRLRSELRQIAHGIDHESVRPLRTAVPARRPGLVRWLAPVTAAAAVVAVIAGVTLARSPAPRHSLAASTGMPPYYVTVDQGPGDDADVAVATVHASATGNTLSSVRLPTARNVPTGQLFFRSISAAADDRTFLIQQVRQLLVLHVSADGQSARLRELPVSLPPTASVALSPDGSTAAIETMSSCKTTAFGATYDAPGCTSTEIRLVSLDTGATTRTWSTAALTAQSTWISWTQGSQILFLWPGSGTASSQPGGLRLLDISTPGSNLLAAQVLPAQVDHQPPFPVPYAFITPDGSTVIYSTTSSDGSVVGMQAASARTGRPLYVLGQHTEANATADCTVLSLGPTGLQALVKCANRSVFLGRVDDGRFTRLPGLKDSWGVAAW